MKYLTKNKPRFRLTVSAGEGFCVDDIANGRIVIDGINAQEMLKVVHNACLEEALLKECFRMMAHGMLEDGVADYWHKPRKGEDK